MKKTLLIFVIALIAASCSNYDEQAIIVQPDKSPKTALFPLGSTRGYDEALSIAKQSIQLVDNSPSTRTLHPRTISNGQCVTRQCSRDGESTTDTLMYVFNFADNAGFAVISANSNALPVIAVTESGNYTYGEATGVEAFDMYMNTIIERQPTLGIKFPNDTVRTDYRCSVFINDTVAYREPLLPVRWGQYSKGHEYPNGVAGCVAVATGQIMAYHKYPSQMTTTYDSYNGNQYFHTTIVFDWNRMIAGASGYTYQTDALMREIGQRVNMLYNVYQNPIYNDSEAYSEDVISCLNSFGYNCSRVVSYSKNAILSDLDHAMPVYIDGDTTDSGHAWVVDGYKTCRVGYEEYRKYTTNDPGIFIGSYIETTCYLHMNWGWSGTCNGYFSENSASYCTTDADSYDYSVARNGTFYGLRIIKNITH